MQLILIDGVPGTGKSVTAQRLALHWQATGARARWFHERESAHPIFHFSHLSELLRHGPDLLEETILRGWRALQQPLSLDVLVLDGTLLNVSVGLMVAMETPLARMRQVVRAIADLIRPFAPSLVLLTYESVDAQLRTVGARRGSQWAFAMHAMLAQTPFAVTHDRTQQQATDLVHAFYTRQSALMSELLELWPGQATTRMVGDGHWEQLQQQVHADVGAPTFAPPRLSTAALIQCAGHYRGGQSRRDLTIATDGHGLLLMHADGVTDRMIPTPHDQRHLVEGVPATITFAPAGATHAGASHPAFRMDSTLLNDRVTTDTFSRVDIR